MATYSHCFWGILFSLPLYYIHSTATSHVYIVYLGITRIHDPILTSKSHVQLLSNVFASKEEAKQSMLYSYKHSFSGFAAKLNSTQATTLAKMKKVVSVFRSKTAKLHTTRSWDFMGLTLDNNNKMNPAQLSYGADVIVGILDSGIWPESESFQEEPCMSPVPSTWKGICVKGEKFDPAKACNRKLIGARYYLNGFEQEFGSLNASENTEYRSARDFVGHGTHTASTAVGSVVKNASFKGFGQGTARGGAPRARLAVYKVCWGRPNSSDICSEADILAAFDDALNDGVHVISVSSGFSPPLLPFFVASADIGSFHAMQSGVSVVFSAGNDGPDPSLVKNVAPWAICVAASSIDRTFPTRIVLDKNISFMGESLISSQIQGKLVLANTYFNNGVCNENNWNKKKAKGKIILCFSTDGPVPASAFAQVAVQKANGSGLIFVDALTKQIAGVDIVPTILVDYDQGTKILHYRALSKEGFLTWFRNFFNCTRREPEVQISPSKTTIGESPAPAVAYFSSRGPNSLSPDILKPDLTAPGINILAAWPLSHNTPPTTFPNDGRSVSWNFQSGTSMSCPHVSGAVALIKSAHPDWSPAAIKSALMTTAYTKDTTLDSILAGGSMKVSDPFDIGAGHINPLKAMDPGLIYDMKTRDYILFLCNIGYTKEQIAMIVMDTSPGTDISCPKGHSTNTDINYPSITVSNLNCTTTIKRTVHNVSKKKIAIYFGSVVSPNGVEVSIWPSVLIFSYFREEISYYVTLKPMKKSQGRYDFGEIVWSDGYHHVRSPLVVLVNTAGVSTESSTHTTI